MASKAHGSATATLTPNQDPGIGELSADGGSGLPTTPAGRDRRTEQIASQATDQYGQIDIVHAFRNEVADEAPFERPE